MLEWEYDEYKGHEKKRNILKDTFGKRKKAQTEDLAACLAEYVEWLRDFAARDSLATQTSAYIDAISPDTHLAVREENARRIVHTS